MNLIHQHRPARLALAAILAVSMAATAATAQDGEAFGGGSAYEEYSSEIREAERDLASGEIDREEYRAEISDAEANYHAALAGDRFEDAPEIGFDGYGYYDRGYELTVDGDDSGWDSWAGDADWY